MSYRVPQYGNCAECDRRLSIGECCPFCIPDLPPEPSPSISAFQQPLSGDTEPELIARISVKGGTLDGKVVEVRACKAESDTRDRNIFSIVLESASNSSNRP